jgi:hypothetical protein
VVAAAPAEDGRRRVERIEADAGVAGQRPAGERAGERGSPAEQPQADEDDLETA